jgi:hypothetical protein
VSHGSVNLMFTKSRYAFVLALSLLFVCGCRKVPQNAPSGTPATQSQSTPSSKPNAEKPSFEGQIEHVSLYPVPNRREDLAVTLIVSVSNSGSPSALEGWELEINSPGRKVPTVLEPVHISGYVELPGTSGPKVDLAKEDLVRKTADASIAKGSSVKGVLTFVQPKTSENDVSGGNTTFTIVFKDLQGNSYRSRKFLIGSKAKPGADK